MAPRTAPPMPGPGSAPSSRPTHTREAARGRQRRARIPGARQRTHPGASQRTHPGRDHASCGRPGRDRARRRRRIPRSARLGIGGALAFCAQYWRPHRRALARVVLLTMAYTLADVLMPVWSGHLIDAITIDQDADAAWTAVAAIVTFGALFWVLRDLAIRAYLPTSLAVTQSMAEDGFARVQRFSTHWHANSFAGATVRKITRGMWAHDLIGDVVFMHLSATLCALVAIITAIALRFPGVAAVVAIIVIVFSAAAVAVARLWVDPKMRMAAESDSNATATLADGVTCNTVVKAFGAEQREDARVTAAYDVWSRANLTAWTRMEHAITLQGALMAVLLAVVLTLAVWLWQNGLATPGDVVFLLTAQFLVASWLRTVGEHVRMLQRGANDIEDLVTFTRTGPQVADRPGAPPLVPRMGAITIRHIRFAYQPDRPIFDDLSLTIPSGQVVALVGHSGSGKSTLVKLIQRLYDLDAGRILIDGQDIAAVTQDSLRRAIALVPQDPLLFHRSLADNIAYGRPRASRSEIEDAARRAQAHEFIQSLPRGRDTLVGERGVKLSGGERQRVAIARAILTDAPILILDEATSSLDSLAEARIQRAIEALTAGVAAGGRTAIIVAHRLSTIRRADRILVFHQGRVVEDETHDALLAIPDGHYRALHDCQADGLLGETVRAA